MSGSAVWYFPYGEARPGSGNPLTDYRFTGQRLEGTIALYDYGARFYDPALGRFISADPIVPRPGNPQSLNRFSYVRNNPLRYVDPSGYVENEDYQERDVDVVLRLLKTASMLAGVPVVSGDTKWGVHELELLITELSQSGPVPWTAERIERWSGDPKHPAAGEFVTPSTASPGKRPWTIIFYDFAFDPDALFESGLPAGIEIQTTMRHEMYGHPLGVIGVNGERTDDEVALSQTPLYQDILRARGWRGVGTENPRPPEKSTTGSWYVDTYSRVNIFEALACSYSLARTAGVPDSWASSREGEIWNQVTGRGNPRYDYLWRGAR